jgi:site-specific recombinase XerD
LFSAWLDFLKLDVAQGAASVDTIRTYTTQIKMFLQWCQQEAIAPLSVSKSDVKAYRYWLNEQGLKTSTIALKLTAVRRLYDGAIEAGLVLSNPAIGVKPPYQRQDPATKITFLEKIEVKQLLSTVATVTVETRVAIDQDLKEARNLFMIELMVAQGLRTVELHRANLGDLVGQGKRLGIRVLSKRQIRIVPLTDKLIELLTNYLAARKKVGHELSADSPLLVAVGNRSRGGRLSRPQIRTLVTGYLTQCGLKHKGNQNVSTHSLRHTAGTLALRAGAELRQVQDLLGHADLRTTSIYLHVSDRWEHNPAKLWLD